MRKLLSCAVLLLELPAFATISSVQSVATWDSTATNCQVTFTPTGGHLIAVWASWTISPGPNNITASVSDSLNNGTGSPAVYPSAVGPTVQSASNTAGQIFYAKNIAGGADVVTVTFSSAPSFSNCVAVEYSGADLNNPLDSVSAGYSSSGVPSNLLDSGNVAPANSNLLVFGAGIADQNPSGGLIAGSGFSLIQAQHNGTIGSAITEQNSAAISGNNVLQRATACLGSSGTGTCLPSSTGDWLMQMAIFRDASWTVQGGWTPVRPYQVLDATQFPGSDIGAQINNAYAALGSSGGHIVVPAGNYSFNMPIVFATANEPVLLQCSPGATFFTYTGTGTAVTLGYAGIGFANPLGQYAGHGIDGCVFTGPGSGTSTIGLQMNGSGGTIGATISNFGFRSFGTGVDFANVSPGSFLSTFRDGYILGNGIGIEVDLNNQERTVFEHVCICNNTTDGVKFTIGGGDYTFLDDHFDFNKLDFLTTAGGGISQSGHHQSAF